MHAIFTYIFSFKIYKWMPENASSIFISLLSAIIGFFNGLVHGHSSCVIRLHPARNRRGSFFNVHKNTFGPALIFVLQRFRPTVVELPCRRRAFVENNVTTLSLCIIS
jgi:hypothetical protein